MDRKLHQNELKVLGVYTQHVLLRHLGKHAVMRKVFGGEPQANAPADMALKGRKGLFKESSVFVKTWG